MNNFGTPTQARIFRFWLPLQSTWLMMAAESPFLAAVIARLPDPKYNLAAYGVAYALAIIVEAPVIMMMSASTALVDSADAYRKLRNFAWTLNILITAWMVVGLFTPIYPWLMNDLIGLDPTVSQLTHTALMILLPWPAAIGYRRFYQGLLIRHGLTRRVAYGTAIRLIAMVGTTVVLIWLRATGRIEVAGVTVGAAALSVGVCTEAVASRLMAARVVTALLAPVSAPTPASPAASPAASAAASAVASTAAPTSQPADTDQAQLTYRGILRFYYPLALTSTIALAVHPVVTFFMGQARQPLESLAMLPVLNALVFIFRTPGLSFQEVAITLLDQGEAGLAAARRFARTLGLCATLGLALVALTPLADFWFETISGLSPDLSVYALLPVRLLIVLPALSVLLSWQRALLVAGRRTAPITWASILEVSGIAIILLTTVYGLEMVGVTAAALAFLGGRLAGTGLLLRPCRRAARKISSG